MTARMRARLIALSLCALAGSATPVAGPPAPPKILDLLNQYGAGDYEGATRSMRDLPAKSPEWAVPYHDPIEPAYRELTSLAPAWIIKDGAGAADRRRAIVASFALELAYVRQAVDWYDRYPYIAWACELLRQHPRRSDAEHWWYLASTAVLEYEGDWVHVVGGTLPQVVPDPPLGLGRPGYAHGDFVSEADTEEFRHGHLAHARDAFPDEPRWRLAEVEYEERLTEQRLQIGPHGLDMVEIPPAQRSALAQIAAGGRPTTEPELDGLVPRAVAQQALRVVASWPAVLAKYQALAKYESLRADVELHVGEMHLRLDEWDQALAHLQQVPGLTHEPLLVSLSHLFVGWVFQRTGRPNEAIAEYRLSLEAASRARTVSILLAAQLGLTGRSSEAHDILDAALRAGPKPFDPSIHVSLGYPRDAPEAPPDPWLLYNRGDGGLVPRYLTRLREALR